METTITEEDKPDLTFINLASTEKTLMIILYNVGPISNMTTLNNIAFGFSCLANMYNRTKRLEELKLISVEKKARINIISLTELGKSVISEMINTLKRAPDVSTDESI